MEQQELAEIESRLESYPVQARRDIMMLMREIRGAPAPDNRPGPGSPLYDSSTGLLNGGAYGVRFAIARARATRYHKIFAVMSIDVVFPGGIEGIGKNKEREQIVKSVGERLQAAVRATDTLARIGDANFAIILEDLAQASDAERVKQIVKDALAVPWPVEGAAAMADTQVTLQFYPSAQTSGEKIIYN